MGYLLLSIPSSPTTVKRNCQYITFFLGGEEGIISSLSSIYFFHFQDLAFVFTFSSYSALVFCYLHA